MATVTRLNREKSEPAKSEPTESEVSHGAHRAGGPARYERMGIAALTRSVASTEPIRVKNLVEKVATRLGLSTDRVREGVLASIYGHEAEGWRRIERGVFQFVEGAKKTKSRKVA